MPRRVHHFFASALASLWVIAAAPSLAEWPVTHFQVFVGKPATNLFTLGVSVEDVIRLGDGYVELDSAVQPPTPVAPALVREIEAYLHESAQRLDAMGFQPPKLEPVVVRGDGKLAYRVYLYDFDDLSGTAAYRSDSLCDDRMRPLIVINSAYYTSDGKTLSDKGYQDLPHELFHAVQRAYPVFNKNCMLGDWIVEGTAQAIGADMAAWSSRRINHPNRTGTWMRDRWGYRAYDTTLWVPDDADPVYKRYYQQNNGYGTSSFWRYLGEHAATGGSAGTAVVKPDYRYLADFFTNEVGTGDRELAEMTWLNDRLLTHPQFKTDLRRIYPQFITTFASYMPFRFRPTWVSPTAASNTWLASLFPDVQCEEIRLSDTSPLFRGRLTLRANAANCYRLNLGFYQPVDLHIELAGMDIEALRAVSMGTEQGAIIAQPMLKKQLDGSWTGSRTLHISQPMSTPQPLLILSNVRQRPSATRAFSGNIEIAASVFDHSMLPAAAKTTTAKKSAKAHSAAAPNGRQTTATQVERVGAELERGLETLNPYLANGTVVTWQTQVHPCDDAFVTRVCGPHTVIGLSAVPGMFASLEQTIGRGGEFGQFFSLLSGMAPMGPLAAGKRYQKALQDAAKLDGVDVTISIPPIDYGFTGRFENAAILVSKRGGGDYRAIGPQDIQPGPGAQYPLSGRVTIEEFTPSILRGSFQAGMVDPDSQANTGEDATLPLAATLSGHFQVVGTWQRDPRIQRETAEDLATSVRRDVAALSAQPNPGTEPNPAGTPDAGSAASTGRASGSSLFADCDCSCNAVERSAPDCDTQCAVTFRACRGQTATELALTESAFQPTVLQASAAKPYLRSLPNACELMDPTTIAQLLAVPKVMPHGPREWIPQALSQCGYRASGQTTYKTQLIMMFKPLNRYDSREHSVDELTRRIIGFGSMEATEVYKAPGNLAILTHTAGASNLIILTGIYGFGWQSEDFGTELVLTYTLSHPVLDAAERRDLLLELAAPQVGTLQKLAVTTHEGE